MMRFLKSIVLVALIACAAVFASRVPLATAADENVAASEMARFEGVWKFSQVKVNGAEQPMAGQEADRLIFQKDGRFTVVQRRGITHGTYTVDAGHAPKQYDVHIGSGGMKGINVPGIYEIAGDTLTICLPLASNQRPMVLESKLSDGHLFEVFQRQHEDVKEVLVAAGCRELTGTWQALSYALDGKKSTDEEMKKFKLVFDAQGNTKALNDGKLFLASSTKIDPTANPATIDITFTAGQSQGTALGIYRLEDNVLTICRAAPGKPRPAEFSSNTGSGLTLTSYRHERAAGVKKPVPAVPPPR